MGKIQKCVQILLLVLVSLAVPSLTLSDKRLCADPNCQVIISEGSAKVTYPAGEAGKIGFKINSNIRIMSKEAGTDKSLWGIEVNGRKGYAPSEYIQEKKVFHKNPQYEVPVTIPGTAPQKKAPPPPPPTAELNTSENEAIRINIESTTTTPLPTNIGSSAAIVTDVSNASTKEAQQGSPVQRTEIVDGTKIPVLEPEGMKETVPISDAAASKAIKNNLIDENSVYDDDYVEDYDEDEEDEEELQKNNEKVAQPDVDIKAYDLPQNNPFSQQFSNVLASDAKASNNKNSGERNRNEINSNAETLEQQLNSTLDNDKPSEKNRNATTDENVPAIKNDSIPQNAEKINIEVLEENPNFIEPNVESKLDTLKDAKNEQVPNVLATDTNVSNNQHLGERIEVGAPKPNETPSNADTAKTFQQVQLKDTQTDSDAQYFTPKANVPNIKTMKTEILQDAKLVGKEQIADNNIENSQNSKIIEQPSIILSELNTFADISAGSEKQIVADESAVEDPEKAIPKVKDSSNEQTETVKTKSESTIMDNVGLDVEVTKPFDASADYESQQILNRQITLETTSKSEMPILEHQSANEVTTVKPEVTESGYYSVPQHVDMDTLHDATTVPILNVENLKVPSSPTPSPLVYNDNTFVKTEHNPKVPEVQSTEKKENDKYMATKVKLPGPNDETTGHQHVHSDISTQNTHETDKSILGATEALISEQPQNQIPESQTPNPNVPQNSRSNDDALMDKVENPYIMPSYNVDATGSKKPIDQFVYNKNSNPTPNPATNVPSTKLEMNINFSEGQLNQETKPLPLSPTPPPPITEYAENPQQQQPSNQFFYNQNPNFVPTQPPVPILHEETPKKLDDLPESLAQTKEPTKTHLQMEPTNDKGLFGTILGTVNSFWQSDKKDAATTNEPEQLKYDDLDHVLFSEQKVKKTTIQKEIDEHCEKACATAQFSDFADMSLAQFTNTLAAKMLEMRELLVCLAIAAATTLFFIFGYYCFCTSSREGALLAKLNLLERSLMASHKENIILRHDLTQTCSKLTSIEDNSFGSNDMVASLKEQLAEELQEKEYLKNRVTTLEKELELAAEAGLELNKIVSDLLSHQSGEETILKSVDDLQMQLDEQQSTILEINTNLAEKSRENSELQLMIAEQTARLEGALASMQQDNEELELEKSNLQTRLHDAKIEFEKEITKALEGKNVEIERLQKDITELKEKFESLYTKWQTSLAKVEALEDCLQTVRRDPKVNINEVINVAHIRGEHLDMQRLCAALKERLDVLSDSKRLISNQHEIVVAELEKLKQDFNQSEKDKLEAQTRLEVLSNYFKEKETQLQKELSLKEAQWLQQQGATTNTVDRLTAMQTDIQSLQSQNDALRAEIDAQLAAHKAQTGTLENRAHETWLAARQSDRKYEEARVEAAALRRKLTALVGGKSIDGNRTVAASVDAVTSNDLNNAPSPLHLDSPASPLFGHLPPPPPFLPPPFMPPPPPFMGMPPPFVPAGELRPAPLGRLMSPTPLRAGRYSTEREYADYYDDDDYDDDDDDNEYERKHRRRHSGVYSPGRSYRSHSPADSRYNHANELSTYDTEYDSSPNDRGRRGSRTSSYKTKSPPPAMSSPLSDTKKKPSTSKDAKHYRGHGRFNDSGSASGNSDVETTVKRGEASW